MGGTIAKSITNVLSLEESQFEGVVCVCFEESV